MTTILLAEDHEDNREMLTRRLQRAGFSVIGAGNGEEAVRAWQDHAPDLILMDVSMPVMSGLEATGEIRRRGDQAIPIIALTAHAMADSREACLAAGCNGFETKPVDFPSLIAAISSHITPAQKEASR